jgi:hypothetical protein
VTLLEIIGRDCRISDDPEDGVAWYQTPKGRARHRRRRHIRFRKSDPNAAKGATADELEPGRFLILQIQKVLLS